MGIESLKQDENGLYINQKSNEDLHEEIRRVAAERAQKVHDERAQRKEQERAERAQAKQETQHQPEPEPTQEQPQSYWDAKKSQVSSEFEKAKIFGAAAAGMSERRPVGEKIYSKIKEEFKKSDVKKFAKEEAKELKGKLKSIYKSETKNNRDIRDYNNRERRLDQAHELRMAKAQGRGAVAGGFNLRTVRQPQRQEYRPQPQASQDVFGMSGIFGGVSAPQTNIGTPRRGVRTEVRNQGRADSVLGLTSYSVVGNAPSIRVSSPKRSNEPQRKVVVREDAVSVLGLGGFVGAGHSPISQNVGKPVSTKVGKPSKIKTKVPLQVEDPLGLNKYSF